MFSSWSRIIYDKYLIIRLAARIRCSAVSNSINKHEQEEEKGNATHEEENREEEVRHEEQEEQEEEKGNATQEEENREEEVRHEEQEEQEEEKGNATQEEENREEEVRHEEQEEQEEEKGNATQEEENREEEVLHSSDDCIVRVPMKRKRLSRCCVYCGKGQQNLSRHLITKHGGEKEVSSIANSNMSKVERRRAFAKIRNCGILKKNSKRDDDYELIHKSQETASVVHCSVCKGSYSSKYFYRHKRSCTRVAIALKAALVATNEGEAFVKILNRFQDNEVGKMCRKDEAIKLLGRHLLQKDRAKVDKDAAPKLRIRLNPKMVRGKNKNVEDKVCPIHKHSFAIKAAAVYVSITQFECISSFLKPALP
ncbi:hypothetical protein CAPTEDRAFT_215529 [Capitella teleta]|uniref:Uncharacterized protein n=1 Tax=Capitella teleta TaxID=283909 RepID=R7T958_CAPTE|nr:hypothetical protein CAPTEDRAFT_215529 [Capitella teleta]|eukprot:ELT87935.1 hypothetical protein CAPTEDRAFT_215529 [Capitella teleta]